jgi:hypothetical protein
MVAAGCLLLIILPLTGLVVGLFAGSQTVAIICVVIGFVIAAATCCTAVFALFKARHRS